MLGEDIMIYISSLRGTILATKCGTWQLGLARLIF
jgi:hypothetical protein